MFSVAKNWKLVAGRSILSIEYQIAQDVHVKELIFTYAEAKARKVMDTEYYVILLYHVN